MIFEQEILAFQILDVLELNQNNIKSFNSGRNFDAISFRYEADTVIESGKKAYELSDNSICYFPSNIEYIRNTKHDKMIVIHFKPFNYHSSTPEVFYPIEPGKYGKLFSLALEYWTERGEAYKHEVSSVLYRIFAELYKDNKPESYCDERIAKACAYIEDNYSDPDISIKDAAATSNISEVYFRKLFKAEFGTSPKQYIINKRINYAAALINAGYYSLQEVADLSGFNDYKYFSVEFKKIVGVSPSEYNYNYMPNKKHKITDNPWT